MFTNDLFLFGNATFTVMEKVKDIFSLYSCFLGKPVDLGTSNILFTRNLFHLAQFDLACVISVRLMAPDTQYLGGSRIHSPPQKLFKDYLISRMDKKLVGGKLDFHP